MASLMASSGLSKNPSVSTKTPIKFDTHPSSISLKGHKFPPQIRSSFRNVTVKASNASAPTGSPGLYSAQKFELTAQNVDLVLEDVRPYLISDGGNVDVVSVEDGVISLKLQGFI